MPPLLEIYNFEEQVMGIYNPLISSGRNENLYIKRTQ